MTSLPQKNIVGILCAVGGAFVFSFNDMAIKFLSGSYALHEVVLFRSVIGLLFLMMVIVPFEGGFSVLKTRRLPAHLFRGLCVVFSNMTFFLAIAALPLAEAVAIFFISPILITVFGAIFLGEKIGPRRALAAVAGLAGVVVMQRPGMGTFQIASLLPLAAAFGYAALHVMTRKIGGTEKAATMAFYIQMTFILVSGVMGLAVGDGRFSGGGDASLDFLLRAWTMPASGDLLWLVLIGIASALGGYLISQAYRLAEAGLAAPFEYVAMPMAIFWGIVVFGEWPDLVAGLGIVLIVGSGLYTFWREAIHGQNVAGETPARR